MNGLAISIRSKQQGVAAIMFAIMLPVLFMFIALGIDGAHFLRASARVADSVEVASLVLSAAGATGATGEAGVKERELAIAYIEHLNSGGKVSIDPGTGITIKACEIGSVDAGCSGDTGESQFIQYELTGSVEHTSLFPTLNKKLGFGDAVNSKRKAVSRQYVAEAIDVVFVADFSGSMWDPWTGAGGQIKINMLKDVIKRIAKTIEGYTSPDSFTTKNTMSLVPFNYGTRANGSHCDVTQLKYTESDMNDLTVDYNNTDSDKFVVKGCSTRPEINNVAKFYTIPPTTDADVIIDAIGGDGTGMIPDSVTASFEGIIRGAQLLNDLSEKNPRQLLIVLSDGEDWNDHRYSKKTIHENLIKDYDYCEKIKKKLIDNESRNNLNVKARLVVIGFGDGYNSEENQNLKKCVGEDNIFDAQNTEDLYDKLIELIGENIGRLYTPAPPADSESG